MGKRTKAQLENQLKVAQSELYKANFRAWEAGKQSRRTDGWHEQSRGPNSDLRQVLQRIVSRHQDQVDSDAWADKAIKVIVTNWIGEGIIGEPVNKNKKYSQIYKDWAESPLCDFYEKLNFYGLQSLIGRTVAVRGSCLIRFRIDERLIKQGLPPLTLQVLEPDWLDMSKDNGSSIIFGKKYDDDGKLESYFIRKNHPGESDWRQSQLGSDEIPASEICHVYDVRRPGQATGVPWGASSLLTLRDIGDHAQARMLLDKLACCFTAFITDSDTDNVVAPSVDPRNPDNAIATLFEKIEPGAIEVLPPGKSIEFSKPPEAGNFIELQRHHLHSVAAGYGITFESLTGILSDVNFSSGRMGWIEFHRNIGHWRWNIMIPQFLEPVSRRLAAAVQMAGMANRVNGRMVWTPPRREMINPSEEIKALVIAIRAGILSLSEVQRSLGYVPQQVLAELAKDLKDARDVHGLVLTVDASQTNDSGGLQVSNTSQPTKPPASETSDLIT
jgi:lambda family phage portal protein